MTVSQALHCCHSNNILSEEQAASDKALSLHTAPAATNVKRSRHRETV